MSKQLDWDAYRYVLDDPTLDRLAFEARMLDDCDLALAVADAMLHVDSIRAASFSATADVPVAVRSSNTAATSGWQLSSLAVLAASLLLAVGWVNYRFAHTPVEVAQRGPTQQGFVESWLAIRQTELVDGSSNLVDLSSNWEAPRDEDPLSESAEPNDEDWLLDAAREYFAQGGAS